MAYVIGISSGLKHGHHDGAAVLMEGGTLVAAAEEERFTLAKHARAELPRNAIAYCLREAGINIEDVDFVCSPLKTYPHYAKRLHDYFDFQFGASPKIELYNHHFCHAASTYFGSGFGEATVVCLDNSGDSASGMVFHAKGSELTSLNTFGRLNSLGLYYGMVTQYLGYQMTNDEYKVMGLAAYGEPQFLDEFSKILIADETGYHLDPALDKRVRDAEIYTTDFSTRQERIFTEVLEDILGPRRLPGAPIDTRIRNIAASLQKQIELVICELIRSAVASTGCANVCLAGGVALNCKANMAVLAEDCVEGFYVPPVPNDAGVALGAAILKQVEMGNAIQPLDHAYWGPEYEPDEIKRILTQVNAVHQEVADPVAPAVEDLLAGKTVGWFQGRLEFGPRALGNRSLLADPRGEGMKDRINETIKYREEFRPFCPSVLLDSQEMFFDASFDAPFMNITFAAKPGAAKQIPAVVHVDGTGRIQSVRAETNPLYHRLISSFEQAGGVPVLLNTSLNINEQPLVIGPLEALHTYFCSGLDVLYLGPYRLAKA